MFVTLSPLAIMLGKMSALFIWTYSGMHAVQHQVCYVSVLIIGECKHEGLQKIKEFSNCGYRQHTYIMLNEPMLTLLFLKLEFVVIYN